MCNAILSATLVSGFLMFNYDVASMALFLKGAPPLNNCVQTYNEAFTLSDGNFDEKGRVLVKGQ